MGLVIDKSLEVLKKEAGELRVKIVKTRLDLIMAKEKNFKKGTNLAHDLSQILTIIREKEITENNTNKQINK